MVSPNTRTAAARIDALLEEVASAYQTLPRKHTASHFRAALARLNLPGGFQRRGVAARPMAESIRQST